jgi:hypothetical protein
VYSLKDDMLKAIKDYQVMVIVEEMGSSKNDVRHRKDHMLLMMDQQPHLARPSILKINITRQECYPNFLRQPCSLSSFRQQEN